MPMPEYLCLLTTSKRRQTDMGLYRSSSHVYWRCKYHIVWTPKYRFRILKDKLGKELYRTIYILCGIKDCEVLELNIQPDHVHLVVIVPPKISISTLMGHLKGRSAIRLYNRFPHIRKKLWGITWILCRYCRCERGNYQTICAASGENGANARTADGIARVA